MNRRELDARTSWLRAAANVVMAACFLVALGALVLYLVHFYRGAFNSDDAVLNLLGEAMRRQGSLLPNGWIYNNGDLMMPFGAPVVALALQWLPNGYAAHSVASLFALALMLASTAWLLRVLKLPAAIVLFFCVLSVAGFGLNLLILLYAQTTYAWWPVGLMLGVALICRHRLGSGGRAAATLALFVLVFSLSFANPARVALMVVLPLWLFDRVLAGAADTGRFGAGSERRWLRRLGLRDPVSGIGIAGAFVGALVLYKGLQHVGAIRTVDGAAALYWGGWRSVWRHLVRFPGDWLAYLAGGRDGNAFGSAASTALYAFRQAFALWMIWVGVSEIAKLPRQRDPLRRALAVASIGAFVPIFFLYNGFEPLAVNGGTIRYFHGSITLLTIQAALRMRDYYARFERPTQVALAIAALALAMVGLQRFVPLAAAGTPRFWNVDSPRIRLAHALEREGLRWGYATWWNAGATTVLSDAGVRVNPVSLGPLGASPFVVMIAVDWYRPEAWTGPSFLVLDPKEQSPAQLEILNGRFGSPLRTFAAAGYRVLVYDHNLALDFREASVVMDAPIASGASPLRLLSADLVAAADHAAPRRARLRLRNDGAAAVSGFGRYPILIGVHLLDGRGSIVASDWRRLALSRPLEPSEESVFEFDLPPLKPGTWTLRFDLGQEHVGWFGDRGAPTIDRTLEILPPPDEIFRPGDRPKDAAQ